MSRSAALGRVVETGGEIVGFVLGWVAADEAELANLAVAAEHRRKGIGHVLLERFCHAARDRGARRITLDVRVGNHPARALYRRHGFAPAGRRPDYYANPVEDALVLSARLPIRRLSDRDP